MTTRNPEYPESIKLFYDLFKHMTTLSTGKIILLSTFLGNVFKSPDWMYLVTVTFVCLTISLVSSLGAMFFFASHLGKELNDKPANFMTGFASFSLLTFLIGIISLTIFASKNL